ncbi:PQQ-dependent sugar dehydrogenase [Streptomyces griseoruber]|uniref:PQQ-dependent sugar dehydrogenase n=1 Tax=Streptomyces griseoruber TaxID=1943 RepID=UPI000AD2A58E|nr:PQQ-dependent sugar dehydrogenase [Streptomyces griseoruber]
MYVAPTRRGVAARTASAATAVAALLLTTAASGAAASPTVPSGIRTVSSGWTNPWGVNWLADGTALINERDTLKVFKVTPAGARTEVTAEPPIAVPGSGETLLGIALSPHWGQDHQIFVYHQAKDGNRIARMMFDGSRLTGYTPLVTGIEKGLHNGGRIKFGPDGYLYATTGDADTPGSAQDRNSLNGKILRMTKEGKPAPGNPFGTLVYSYGHRNPEGIDWDDQGNLWETEIGEDTHDELNLVQAGGNYGWPSCEGVCSTAGMTDPKRMWYPVKGVPSGLVHVDGALYVAALRGRRLWRVPVDGTSLGTPVAYYAGGFGRLRDVVKVPGRQALWVTTDKAGPGKDRVLQVDLG